MEKSRAGFATKTKQNTNQAELQYFKYKMYKRAKFYLISKLCAKQAPDNANTVS